MSPAVQQIIELIDLLPEADREALDQELADLAESVWREEAAYARQEARKRGIDQQTIDQATEAHRRQLSSP